MVIFVRQNRFSYYIWSAMRKRYSLHIIPIFLLFTFLCVKMTGLHAFAHGDEGDGVECVLCEVIVDINTMTFTGPAVVAILFTVIAYRDLHLKEIQIIFIKAVFRSNCFSRPPPFLS
jgi:hypothetical protein